MTIPPEYVGKEQTYLKHRVLQEYVLAWAHKLASVARQRAVRLCYIDGFAGPWKAKSANLDDTSIAIGLRALEAACATWKSPNLTIDAAFVERDPAAFGELQKFLGARSGAVKTMARQGEFGAFVSTLKAWMAGDAALVFVNPTGWKGAAMQFIAPLVDRPRRDVLVNVMFDHIRRFKDDPRPFLREQMRDFFGLAMPTSNRTCRRRIYSRSTGES